jgi:phosphoribosyl 1,2-cyclic phosphate phosphodiesterase
LKKGGKEIRKRAGFLINDDLMIDFSADTFSHMITNKFDLSAVKDILISHSHDDHYYLPDIIMRSESDVSIRKEKYVNLRGNKAVVERFNQATKKLPSITCIAHEINPNDGVVFGDYKITAFNTRHMPTEDALIYLIENNGKTYFHVLDSDYPNEEVFDYVKSHNIKLDCVTVDCTFGLMREEFGGHMNIWQNVRIKERLEKLLSNIMKRLLDMMMLQKCNI